LKKALYFDTVNFASRNQAQVEEGMGFIDAILLPAGCSI
jgi:cephalosporin-C deacetylase-like acetyl esterase